MLWNRSNAIGPAKALCKLCKGMGMVELLNERQRPCHCVFRAAFRACYRRFRECTVGSLAGSVSWDVCPGQGGHRVYSRKREEYVADFYLVSRRTLTEEEYRIFRFFFLLGADWKLCTRRLNMDRGKFFHQVYRIEQKLGKAFAELEPYPLYPVSNYFYGERLARVVAPKAPPTLKELFGRRAA